MMGRNVRVTPEGMMSRMSRKRLPPQFYLQDTVQVAQQLIGKLLCRRVDGQLLSALICERHTPDFPTRPATPIGAARRALG